MPVNDALLHNWFYGNYGVRIAAAVIFAFLIASLPFAAIMSWLFAELDPRLQRAVSAIVPVLNVLKGFISTVVAFHGGGAAIGLGAAFAAVLGHYYSPWRRFAGEHNVDLLIGLLLATSPPVAAIVAVVWAVGAATSRSSATGTLLASGVLFLPMWFFLGPPGAFFGIAAGAAIAARLGVSGEFL
jgi:glycerol-3-phosphate acyltransferase PlsY